MTTTDEFLTAYESISSAYKKAMQQVDVALQHEENARVIAAISAYELSLRSIEATFAIPVGLPENINEVAAEWANACKMIQALKSAKTEATSRLKALRAQDESVDNDSMEAFEVVDAQLNDSESVDKHKPVLLENAVTHSDSGDSMPKTYQQIVNGLRELMATKDSGALFDTLFQAQVKLYKIEPNGVVSTVAGETPMSLVMCTVGGKWHYLNGICFIQCNISDAHLTSDTASTSTNATPRNMVWLYPLVPILTTCYRTEYGAFILPDIESNMAGAAFGIMLVNLSASAADDGEQLADLQQFFLDLLEAVLAGTVQSLEQLQVLPADKSQQISMHIINAADFIARNLVKGAEKTGELMVKTTPYIIAKMKPAPSDTPPVSTTVQTTVEVAKSVSNVAVSVTGWVAGKVGTASMALGSFLAPHVQSHGATILQKGFGYDSAEANSKMEGAMTIAAGAVEGFSTVYNGLETSAKILGTNLSDNSVKIIEHKYGSSVGNVAAGTFDTLGNAFIVSNNVNYITPKGIAKKMAKHTGKAVVDDYKRNLRKETHVVPAGALYPDLRSLKD